MKLLKKISTMLLILVLLLSSVACSGYTERSVTESGEASTARGEGAASSAAPDIATGGEEAKESSADSDFKAVPDAEAPAGAEDSIGSAKREAEGADETRTESSTQSTDTQIPQTPEAGVLTAGEWNDNRNFDFIRDLTQSNQEWQSFYGNWEVQPTRRIAVNVGTGNDPITNATVRLVDANKNVIWTAITDNRGVAYLFNGIEKGSEKTPQYIQVITANDSVEVNYDQNTLEYSVKVKAAPKKTDSLDLMVVLDTTGSMGDEHSFLVKELEGVVSRVRKDNANIEVRLSTNVYRDHGDEYVVRSTPFSNNISKNVKFLAEQTANGGGDYEEAVEVALKDAIEDHDWNQDATARIILLVLDAPPHNTASVRTEMVRLMEEAAAKGIRVVPVASSGVDKDTEFLLRMLSITSGGTYTFLTDHSGVGGSHIEPTIGSYKVEKLNDLLVRVINSYVGKFI